MELVRRAELLLHTGDLTTRAVLDELASLGPPVHAVRGNIDEPELRAELPERLVIEWKGRRIGVVHDAGSAQGRHERLRSWFPSCDLVAYGHTHLPETALADGVWIVNPGSPTERRRAPARTMAVVVDGRPTLIRFS